ncbi:hypothetical protein PAXINDRAFT_27351, partial [Paxillus involutus ATCC 200175]
GHERYIRRIAYLPGGERVVTCSYDKTIRIWDVEKGEQEGTSMVHEDAVHGLAVTRDGKRILGGGWDKKISVWDVETHEQVEEWASHTSHIECIALSPDDQLAASGTADGKIVITSRAMKESGEIKHWIHTGHRVDSLCFSPNGQKLACGGIIGTDGQVIQIYGVESGQLVISPMKGHEDIIRCVLWSHDGSQLFSASDDHTIRCWDTETGELIGEPWTGHTDTVFSLSLSPDGTKLASISRDSTVRFWDAHSGDPIEHPLQHETSQVAVTFSPSGEFVASGGYDGKLSIWRV